MYRIILLIFLLIFNIGWITNSYANTNGPNHLLQVLKSIQNQKVRNNSISEAFKVIRSECPVSIDYQKSNLLKYIESNRGSNCKKDDNLNTNLSVIGYVFQGLKHLPLDPKSKILLASQPSQLFKKGTELLIKKKSSEDDSDDSKDNVFECTNSGEFDNLKSNEVSDLIGSQSLPIKDIFKVFERYFERFYRCSPFKQRLFFQHLPILFPALKKVFRDLDDEDQ